MYFINKPHLQVSLKALLGSRPDEAAEVLLENCLWECADEIGSIPGTTLESCKTYVGLILQGHTFIVHTPDQKSLNALAGYFWVEPRRLPAKKAKKYTHDQAVAAMNEVIINSDNLKKLQCDLALIIDSMI